MPFKKKIITLSASLIIFVIAIEAFSYLSLKLILNKADEEKGRRDALYYQKKITHPYLGFVTEDVLNLLDYSSKPNSNIYEIAIMGGSVAHQICEFEKEKHLIQKNIEEMRGATKIDCLAFGGARQPQQLILHTLYGKKYDLIISIEGHNEIFHRLRIANNSEFPLTRISHLFFTDSNYPILQKLKVLTLAFLHKAALNLPEKKSNFIDLLRLATINLSRKMALTNDEDLLNDPHIKLVSVEERINIWLESLTAISEIRRKQKIITVIQPFLEFKKEFSPEERTHAQLIEKRRLEAALALQTIRSKDKNLGELKIIDASNLYQVVKKSRFIDAVHLNKLALEELTRKIVSEI